MKSLQELTVRGAETDTSTTQISEVQGTDWLKSIVQYAENMRYFDQAGIIKDYPEGDVTIVVPKTTAVLSIDLSPSGGEGDVRDYTELTNLDTVSMTLASGDWKRGAVAITKQIALTSRIDLVGQARYAIAQGLAEDVDDAIATVLQGSGVSNVYGGDATAVTELEAGDICTSDLLAEAKNAVEQYNWVAKHCFLHSVQVNKHLLKDSQFVNAAEYGDDRIVKNGEIGTYLGMKVYMTNNCPAYAQSGTDVNESAAWAVAGKVGFVIGERRDGERVAFCLAWKERPTVDYEYRKDRAIHVIYADQTYDTALIQATAVCLVKTANT